MLDILAAHPSTARFIATKLARRFVADHPPPSLVDRAAAVFRQTDGDLREVVRAIVTSPEFFAPEAYRAKVKTPFEFVVSALRATGADIQQPRPLERTLRHLGMPLYLCQPPTGYKDTAEAWVNSGALINRMNFAVALAATRSAASWWTTHCPTQPGGRRDGGRRLPARRRVRRDARDHSQGDDGGTGRRAGDRLTGVSETMIGT